MIGSDNCIDPHRFPRDPNPLGIMARGGVASTSERPQQSGRKNTKVRYLRSERPVGVLSEWEFQAHFHITNNIPFQLTDNEALSFNDIPSNMMYFTKEQFIVELCLPILSFQAISSFHINPSNFSSSERCLSVNKV